jgi:hypothetical protein
MSMNSHKWMVRFRIVLFLIALTSAVAFLSPVAGAQVYLYGRADFPAPGNPGGVVVADFNGDGRPDVAISDSQNNLVSVLLGTANGGFLAAGSYATGPFPTSLVAADFNGDKKLDLAVVNANAGTISVLLGNGDGTFQNRVDYAVGQSPAGIVAADFDSDGNIDLATISTSDSAMAILLGKGDGSFEVQALIPVASGPTLLAGGDVNGDGRIDLITANNNYSSGTITVLVSKGDGTFTQVQSQCANYASEFVVGDFNRDGKLDLLMVASFGLYLSLGNGDGSFQSAVAIPNSPNSFGSGLLVGDFNHDRKLDIALSGAWVMLGNGDGTFQNPILSTSSATPRAVVDMNGDGEPDLVATTNSGAVAVLLGNGTGSFMDLQNVALASASYPSQAAVAADFNGDGKLDLAVAESNYPNGQVSVELGKGNGTFGQPIVSALSTNATSAYLVLAGDFNSDHKSDLVVLDDNGFGFQVLLGNGDGSFGTPVDTPLTYSLFSLAVGDFNNDGKADLAVTTGYNSSPSVNVFLGNGDGTFRLGGQYLVYGTSYVSVADVNGDGNLDLIVDGPNSGASNLLVFLGTGDGTFKNPVFGPSDNYLSQPVIGDFNHDGRPDIAVGTSGGIAFLAGNGDGTFGTQVYSDAGFQFSSTLIASDFNGDHKLDLAAPGSYYLPGAAVMIGNGDGTFGPPQEYDYSSNGNQPNVVAGDFNSDGVSDLGIPGQSSTSNTPVVFLYLSTPTPNLLPTALDFGGEPVGKTSSPRKVKLSNTGNARLKISSITVSGDFLEQDNCGKGLAAGRSCTIQISFKPQAKGIRRGQVTIADSAPGHRQRVSLKGTGE